MNKPTIPNEVADAIELLKDPKIFRPPYTNGEIVEKVLSNNEHSAIIAIRTITFDTLIAALVNGYERELTYERRKGRIREEYESNAFNTGGSPTDMLDRIYAKGIRFTLDTLGIQIEGVNA
ncbi:hypothetical protein NQ117_05560 [Paenibacillus sp. SC116]|uniref:hypothetical protein n=1 Tax=Paenibacillus sp. SC116 TaxID=2968986 RepID=UPI00215ADBF8|nr:hypothetical protein [Paenibacillus sp. SC116]MCR8843140.1 hypothetical protein [Paenibacillus sp. SC116]